MRKLIAALYSTAVLTTAATADNIRTTTTYVPLPYTPAAIIALDLNGDGLDDPVVFATNPNRYQIFLTNPDGTFNPQPVVNLQGTNIGPVRKTDLNNDGLEDIVMLVPSLSSFFILLNTGQGTLVQPPSSPVPTVSAPQTFAIGDANSDGIADIVVGYSARIAFHAGLGGGVFGVADSAIVLPATTLTDMTMADLTDNGVPEIAVLSSGTVYILNQAEGVYTLGPTLTLANTGYRIAGGDTNGDGIDELVIPILNRIGVIVCRYNPSTGNYTSITPSGNLPSITSSGVAFGDINSNGRLDLALANSGASPARYYFSTTGPAPIYREADQPIGEFFDARFVTFLDANGDGRTDIAYASVSPNALMLVTQDSFGTFRNNGFNQALAVTPARITRMPDRLGNPSFFVGHTTSAVLQRATLVPDFSGFTVLQETLSETLGGSNQGGWHIADVNGDGVADIVYTAVESSIARFRWQLGTGPNTFTPVLNRPVPDATALNTPVVADFNQDGITDVAALTSSGSVAIAFGQASGFLSQATVFPMTPTTTPGSLLAVDLDRDGYTDLVCANRQSGTSAAIFIAYGRPGGAFDPPVQLPTIANPGSLNLGLIDAGDINGDGTLDIVIGSTSGQTAVHLSNGARSYAPAQPVTSGTGLTQLKLVDLDGDGYPEIAASYRGHTLIASRNGLGFFESRTGFLHAESINSWHFEDLNGDGLLDLVYASPNGMSVLYNRSGPRCIADHNADGNLDLFDIAAFIRDFNLRNPLIDFNVDGQIDFFDLARFIQAFTAGCP